MKNNYGEAVRVQREQMGLTQKDIAEELGLSEVSISNRENEKIHFRVEELYKAYKSLGIDIGFGYAFDLIDQGGEKLEEILVYFTEKDKKPIREKDYKNLQLFTMEKMRDLLRIKFDNVLDFDFLNIQLTQEEKVRLRKVLIEYQNNDANIERALKLLEIAVQK